MALNINNNYSLKVILIHFYTIKLRFLKYMSNWKILLAGMYNDALIINDIIYVYCKANTYYNYNNAVSFER